MAKPKVTRRLAAILAADVVGYSRLIRSDEEGTLARLKAVRDELIDPAIAKHGGRIVKTMGDGVLVEFPSAVDAVRNAVEVQQAIAEREADTPEDRRMVFRVGVNLGDVVIDGDDIHGDGVNVAARLEALAEPGSVCISGKVYEEIRDRVELPFEDLGPQKIKNIDRPVPVWRWTANLSANADAGGAADKPLPLPDKPSIAVLPFENMSGDAEQDFFADGMAEDIITGLSRYRSLHVIARNSTFAYKGQSPDLRDVARELGVRFVLEGSIRKSGSRIRVTAQLIEGTTGNHIWAERFDRELDDIFAVQDEVTAAIVAAIGPELDQVERERAQRLPPENLDAWECYQRGLWHLYRFNPKDNAASQLLFSRAIQLSPNFSRALSGLTHAHYYSFIQDVAEDKPAALAKGFETGRQAVAADERDADAHFALGRILYLRHELDDSVAEFETAIAYNPSFAHAYLGLATALMYTGDWDRAVESTDRAVSLSPHDPLLWLFFAVKAMILVSAKRLEQAVEAGRQSARHPAAAWTAYLGLAAALGQLGKDQDAKKAMTDMLRKNPDLSAEHMRDIMPFRDPANLEYFIEGLRKAGMLK